MRALAPLVFLFLIFSCTKTEVIELNLTGTIIGKVETIDEFGQWSEDYEGIRVELDGSDPIIFTQTDSSGRFELNEVPTGTYNVIFTKEGYGENQVQGFKLVGGDKPVFIHEGIGLKPTFRVEGLSAKLLADNQIEISGRIIHSYESSPNPLHIIISCHLENNPSPSNNLFIIIHEVYIDKPNSQPFNFLFEKTSDLESGQPLFMVSHGINKNMYGYIEITSNSNIITALGPASNTTSIEIP